MEERVKTFQVRKPRGFWVFSTRSCTSGVSHIFGLATNTLNVRNNKNNNNLTFFPLTGGEGPDAFRFFFEQRCLVFSGLC